MTKGKEYEEVVGEEWSDGMVSDNYISFGGNYEGNYEGDVLYNVE